MPRPKPIEWPNKAKIAVTFIVPWEVWPENFATRESHQRSSHRAPPANAAFSKNMAAVSGVPYRTKIMDEFIGYAKGFPDVWFARRLEIATWCLKQGY